MTASCLSIISSPPLSSANSAEALELLLVAAAFDVPTTLLFSGAGVLNLIPEQSADGLARKTPSKQLGALKLYGVESVYACKSSMQRYGVTDTVIDVLMADSEMLKTLISAQDMVFSHR
ncbi:MAG: DsrE family protein [Pseudomonadaceae bacterium]|nr:DsrE family protein [Pseudomonadaceae bacterium]